MAVSTQMIVTPDLSGSYDPGFSTMMILVGGLPGSGKSYFALRLSDRLGATYISSDVTMKQMDAQGQYAFEDKLNVYEEMARRASKELRRARGVVVDATFYCKEMRDIFFTLAKLLHREVAYIEIVADEQIILDRLSHPRANTEADLSVYRLVKCQYEKPDIEHLVIESKTDNIQGMLMKATEYISKLNEERKLS